MQTSELWELAAALAVGLLLGVCYFGGLLWTVHLLPTSRRPALLFLGSWFLRTAVLVTGLWLVTAGDWRRPVAALVGILAIRIWLVHRVRRAEALASERPATQP